MGRRAGTQESRDSLELQKENDHKAAELELNPASDNLGSLAVPRNIS